MVLLVCVIFLCGAVLVESSINVGNPCSLTDGSPGICTVLHSCQPVLDLLMSGIIPSQTCGYVGYTPVVCCPTNAPVTTTPIPTTSKPSDGRGEIARRKCTEYSQYVYTVMHPMDPLGRPLSLNVSQCEVQSIPLITGGTKAGRKEFPHMAAVGYDMGDAGIGWHCGSTLISEKFVLTAAHCTYSQAWGEAKWVRLGDLNLMSSNDGATPIDHRIADRIRHPDYRPPAQYHDIALLRLESPVTFNGWIRPACLHTSPSTGTERAIATGWGRVEWIDDEGSEHLLKVTLPLVDQSTCHQKYTVSSDIKLPNGVNEDWSLCAGEAGRDTCQGDSGGPLVIFDKVEFCMYDIVGVTSLGKLCGSGFPGVYTRVYHYVSWIEGIVWGNNA